MPSKRTVGAAARPKTMTDYQLSLRVYEYGGGGNVNMNAVSEAIRHGEAIPPDALRKSIAQIDEYLTWPDGARMGGPLGGRIDHAELRKIRALLRSKGGPRATAKAAGRGGKRGGGGAVALPPLKPGYCMACGERPAIKKDPDGRMKCDGCREATMDDFEPGQGVVLHPATDRWMMGDRLGRVVRKGVHKGTPAVYVELERSGKKLWFAPRNILVPKRGR